MYKNLENPSALDLKMLEYFEFGSDTKHYMKFKHDSVIDNIQKINPKLVVDVGCGRNVYKKYFDNLIGIDIADYEESDRRVSILNAGFEENSVDAVIAMGVIQFWSIHHIHQNIDEVVKWVKPNGLICMKVNFWHDEMIDMLKLTNNKLRVMPWSRELVHTITEKHKLEFEVEPYETSWNFRSTPRYEIVKSALQNDQEKLDRWNYITSNLKKLNWIWKKI